ALESAGYTSFLDIIDLEREDLLRVPGIAAEQADNLLQLIESLTVEEGANDEGQAVEGAPTDEELEEAKQLAADVLGLPMPERKTPAPSTEDAGRSTG
ncbi:MAG TPA: helix-hairpin-helix domain-containing protein, partial [Longimicrobiales bacterium]|nr:helix-hairpin-helix domain-containing protein [Longimicrobiales bacterium]